MKIIDLDILIDRDRDYVKIIELHEEPDSGYRAVYVWEGKRTGFREKIPKKLNTPRGTKINPTQLWKVVREMDPRFVRLHNGENIDIPGYSVPDENGNQDPHIAEEARPKPKATGRLLGL